MGQVSLNWECFTCALGRLIIIIQALGTGVLLPGGLMHECRGESFNVFDPNSGLAVDSVFPCSRVSVLRSLSEQILPQRDALHTHTDLHYRLLPAVIGLYAAECLHDGCAGQRVDEEPGTAGS